MASVPITTSSFYTPAFRPVGGRVAIDPVGRVRRVVGESEVERARVADASAQVEISDEARALARTAATHLAAVSTSEAQPPRQPPAAGRDATVSAGAATGAGTAAKASTAGPVLDDRVRRAFRNRGTAARVDFGSDGGDSPAAGDANGPASASSDEASGTKGARGEKGDRARRLQVPKEKGPDGRTLSEREQRQVKELADRDREVRTHEAAHMAAGGPYAGGATYTYQTGPDGKRYAIGGEVSIDTSPVKGDPEATLRKMESVQRAALAPGEPSGTDRAIAASAAARAQRLRASLGTDGMTDEDEAKVQHAMGTDEGSKSLAVERTGVGAGAERHAGAEAESTGSAVQAAPSPARRVATVVELGDSASLKSPAKHISGGGESLTGSMLRMEGRLDVAESGAGEAQEAEPTTVAGELASPPEAVKPSGPRGASEGTGRSAPRDAPARALGETPSVSVWVAPAW